MVRGSAGRGSRETILKRGNFDGQMDSIALEHFLDKICPDPNSGCWLWLASLDTHGYGHIGIAGRIRQAHRISFLHFMGPIPQGRELDHLCRVRSCVNPRHLEPVTKSTNQKRGIAGATLQASRLAKTHCRNGHEYSGMNLILKNGYRQCRECHNINNRKHYANKMACAPQEDQQRLF